jgi:hypothetical protein
MEKYGQTDLALKDSLLMEEAELMKDMTRLMCSGEKTSEEFRDISRVETRLQYVRAKITEMDGKV